MSDGTANIDNVRAVASLELNTALQARNRLVEEHAASFRWLIASLFAANGGALIALGGSHDVPAYAKLWACSWFTVGIFFALLTAWLNQRAIQKILDPISELIAFWGAVAHGLELDLTEHAKLMENARSSTKKGRPVQVSGWASAIVFLFGMVAAGTGFWDQSKQAPADARVVVVN